MILDIIIAIIVIVAMAFGFYNGFVKTLAQAGGWLAAVVVGFLLSPWIKDFIINHTEMQTNIQSRLMEKGFIDTDPMSTGSATPNIIQNASIQITDFINETIASNLATLFISIFSFVIIIIFFKLLMFVIVKLFSRRENFGFASMSDGILGACAGAFQAMVITYLILAIMFPIIGIVAPELADSLMDMLDNSTLAEAMYENNLLLLFVQSIF